MIVRIDSRLTTIAAALSVLAFAGSAYAGLAPASPAECSWGVARVNNGNFKFFIDADQDGVTDSSFVFGPSTSQILIGDWDGDDIETVAIRRDVSGQGKFFFDNNNNATAEASFVLGETAAIPVSGDWDGDGLDNVGVRRIVNGLGKFFLDTNGDNQVEVNFVLGNPADVPVVGDWDGDGDDDLGIVRTIGSGLRWFLTDDAGVVTSDFAYGSAGDTPIVGDFDNDGDSDPGLIRNVSGVLKFLLDTNRDGTPDFDFAFGSDATDVGFACQFSGTDMKDEIGIARQDSANTALRFITTSALDGLQTLRVRFGNDTDTPFVGIFEAAQ